MIILSCGHQADELYEGYNVIAKEMDRRGEKALAYKTVCVQCMNRLLKNNELLKTDEDGFAWLKDKNW